MVACSSELASVAGTSASGSSASIPSRACAIAGGTAPANVLGLNATQRTALLNLAGALAQAAGYLVRSLATGRALPKGAENVMQLWRGHLEAQAGTTLAGIETVLGDQQAFARFARQVIDDLGYGAELGEDPDLGDEDEERFLTVYFGEPPDARQSATLKLFRYMSDLREAMWGVVQTAISALDFDFEGYAHKHFERLASAAADPRFAARLEEARAGGP